MNIKKSLCILSGDDYSIIKNCRNKEIENRFVAIGSFVFCIFILCFVSSYFSFTMLFQNFLFGIPVSIFFSWMITNIYLLLLYTLTKNVLPHKRKIKARIISVTLRLIFICFIAVIVSKPIEVLFFSNQLNSEVAKYKLEQIEKYTALTADYFNKETDQLKYIIESQKKIYKDTTISMVEQYEKLLSKKEEKKYQLILEMRNLVTSSNYYIQSIIILNKKIPSCWIITLISIIIFLTPAYLKNYIGEENNYYDLKKQIEMNLIQKEYYSFKRKYSEILLDKHNENKIFSELFYDTPFNTKIKIDEREFLKEDNLIEELYNG